MRCFREPLANRSASMRNYVGADGRPPTPARGPEVRDRDGFRCLLTMTQAPTYACSGARSPRPGESSREDDPPVSHLRLLGGQKSETARAREQPQLLSPTYACSGARSPRLPSGLVAAGFVRSHLRLLGGQKSETAMASGAC